MGFLRKIFGAPASIVLGSIQQIPAFMITSQFTVRGTCGGLCQVSPGDTQIDTGSSGLAGEAHSFTGA